MMKCNDVYVAGVGMTRFMKYRDTKNVIELGLEAVIKAIKDAGIDKKEIQTVYCGHARTGRLLGRECGVGQAILWRIGVTGIPVTSVGNFCASGGNAFREAWIAVASGMYDVALAIGVEQMSVRKEKGRPLTSDGLELLSAMGFTPPSQYAQVANRYMYEYGATRADFAQVAVKNRGNAVLNPYAQYRKAVTLEEVLNAPVIVDPLTLLSSCPIADGGAAAVLVSKRVMDRIGLNGHSCAIRATGVGLRSGVFGKHRNYLEVKAEEMAAQDAYEMAGIGPEDVALAEVHDAFTPGEIIHYETLGFCEKGHGFELLKSGATQLSGRLPVNPSGGLLAKGHPLGATGLGQVFELVTQMRGEAGERQVQNNPKVAVGHCSGGFSESPELGEAQATSVILLQK